MEEAKKIIEKDMIDMPKHEKENIISEIRESITDESSFGNVVDKFYRNQRKISKIIDLLQYSSYNINQIQDSGFSFFSRLAMFTYGFYVLGKRRRWYSYILLGSPLPVYHYFFHDYVAKHKGLYKSALFNEDELSQEIRLLLLYHDPQNKYAEIIRNNIAHYNKDRTSTN